MTVLLAPPPARCASVASAVNFAVDVAVAMRLRWSAGYCLALQYLCPAAASK